MENKKVDPKEFEKLPLKERILITASGKLIKHIRGLESAQVIAKDNASSLIGCVKKIVAIAKGEEQVATK